MKRVFRSLDNLGGVSSDVPVVADKSLQHGESVGWLIHGHHVSSVVNSKEVEVSVLAQFTGRCAINCPRLVGLSVEF